MAPSVQLDQARGEPIDGRTARSHRTRDALVDATIELVEEGDLRPTAPRVAERAGVSVRSVFQHFDDLETLFAAVGARVTDRLVDLVEPVDATLPLRQRITAFARMRADLLEAVSPINRAAVLQLPTSPTIDRQFRDAHRFLVAQVDATFSAELAGADAGHGDGGAALRDGLVHSCSWATWNVLRSLERRSCDEATEVLSATIGLLLAGAAQRSTMGADDGRT